MSRIALSFTNASCAHCVRLVTNKLERVAGIADVRVDPEGLKLYVDFDPSRTTTDSIRTRMEMAGYPARLLENSVPATNSERQHARAA